MLWESCNFRLSFQKEDSAQGVGREENVTFSDKAIIMYSLRKWIFRPKVSREHLYVWPFLLRRKKKETGDLGPKAKVLRCHHRLAPWEEGGGDKSVQGAVTTSMGGNMSLGGRVTSHRVGLGNILT